MTAAETPRQTMEAAGAVHEAKRVAGYIAGQRTAVLPPTQASVRGELRDCSELLRTVDATRTELYEWRLDLLREARALTPAITQRELAELTGVSEAAIIKVLQKARQTSGA